MTDLIPNFYDDMDDIDDNSMPLPPLDDEDDEFDDDYGDDFLENDRKSTVIYSRELDSKSSLIYFRIPKEIEGKWKKKQRKGNKGIRNLNQSTA